MNTNQEIEHLLKSIELLKNLRSKTFTVKEYSELSTRIDNLNHCLHMVLWQVYGKRINDKKGV